jgi:hypothetical protein
MTIVKDLVTVLAIFAGGAWALFQFIRWREGHAKLAFELQLNILGNVDERLLVEVVAVVENKGKVRHRVSDFCADVYYLADGVKLVTEEMRKNPEQSFQPALPNRMVISDAAHNTVLDPGITKQYSFLTSLPASAAFALVKARFRCPQDGRETHNAQKCFGLKTSAPSGNATIP